MEISSPLILSIPLSALATFIALSFGDGTINTMVLGGLALAFSRLIDNSVVVLENIFRHLEMDELPEVAAEKGASEVALPVPSQVLDKTAVNEHSLHSTILDELQNRIRQGNWLPGERLPSIARMAKEFHESINKKQSNQNDKITSIILSSKTDWMLREHCFNGKPIKTRRSWYC